MPKSYRALLSVPIAADDDDEAYDRAADYARSLLHPQSDVIAGHVELVIESYPGSLEAKRVVMEAPGLWRQLDRSKEFLATQYEQDFANTPFTQAEQAQITNQIQQIKAYIEKTYELSSEHTSRVEDRFDRVEQASHRLGRKDWLGFFYGAVFSLLLTDSITPQVAQHILMLTIDGLSHLFGIGGPPPPHLPPGR